MCAVSLDDGCNVLLNTAGPLELRLNMVGDRKDVYYVMDVPEAKGLDRVGMKMRYEVTGYRK